MLSTQAGSVGEGSVPIAQAGRADVRFRACQERGLSVSISPTYVSSNHGLGAELTLRSDLQYCLAIRDG